jgi:hypothetical protein
MRNKQKEKLMFFIGDILKLVGIGAIIAVASQHDVFKRLGRKPKIDPALAKVLQDKGIDPAKIDEGVLEALRGIK